MKFKERAKDDTYSEVITLRDDLKPMPEPEVGKIYHGFDDGKITLSRLVDWKITKRIDLDHDKVSKHLLKVLQRDIKQCYWVFDTEQTIIFHAKAVDENGKYDKQIGTCYFIRTQWGTWFSAYSNAFWWCELDVDNRWYDDLVTGNDDLIETDLEDEETIMKWYDDLMEATLEDEETE